MARIGVHDGPEYAVEAARSQQAPHRGVKTDRMSLVPKLVNRLMGHDAVKDAKACRPTLIFEAAADELDPRCE